MNEQSTTNREASKQALIKTSLVFSRSQKPRGKKTNKHIFFRKQSSVPAYGPVEQRALVVEPPAAVHRREEVQLPQRRRDRVRPDGDALLRRRPPRRLLPVHLRLPSALAVAACGIGHHRSDQGERTNGFLIWSLCRGRQPERIHDMVSCSGPFDFGISSELKRLGFLYRKS